MGEIVVNLYSATEAAFPPLRICPQCGAVLLTMTPTTDPDDGVREDLELMELHYYARPGMRHVVSEPHVCPEI